MEMHGRDLIQPFKQRPRVSCPALDIGLPVMTDTQPVQMVSPRAVTPALRERLAEGRVVSDFVLSPTRSPTRLLLPRGNASNFQVLPPQNAMAALWLPPTPPCVLLALQAPVTPITPPAPLSTFGAALPVDPLWAMDLSALEGDPEFHTYLQTITPPADEPMTPDGLKAAQALEDLIYGQLW